MTANVVSFPDAYREYGFINGKRCRVPRCKEDYLHLCKEFLEAEDYEQILCGIMDYEYYLGIDEKQIKVIIDCYFSFDR